MKKLLCSLFALSAVSTAMAQEVNIKLLGTSDIHGRVVPWSYGADVEDKSGSYAQIATYVKDVRKNNKNVVLVDVGDAIQDNQVDVFAKDKKYYKDHPIPKVLNEMKYDVFALMSFKISSNAFIPKLNSWLPNTKTSYFISFNTFGIG